MDRKGSVTKVQVEQALPRAGVKIYEWQGEILHANHPGFDVDTFWRKDHNPRVRAQLASAHEPRERLLQRYSEESGESYRGAKLAGPSIRQAASGRFALRGQPAEAPTIFS